MIVCAGLIESRLLEDRQMYASVVGDREVRQRRVGLPSGHVVVAEQRLREVRGADGLAQEVKADPCSGRTAWS